MLVIFGLYCGERLGHACSPDEQAYEEYERCIRPCLRGQQATESSSASRQRRWSCEQKCSQLKPTPPCEEEESSWTWLWPLVVGMAVFAGLLFGMVRYRARLQGSNGRRRVR
jgi:hypothetical protein